jgi:hypothetical protein
MSKSRPHKDSHQEGEEELERKYALDPRIARRRYDTGDLRECYRRAFAAMQADTQNFPHFDPIEGTSGREYENKGFRPRIYLIDASGRLRPFEIRLQYDELQRLMVKSSNDNPEGSATLRRYERKVNLIEATLGDLDDIVRRAVPDDYKEAKEVRQMLRSHFKKADSPLLYPGVEILSFREKFNIQRGVRYQNQDFQVTLELSRDVMRKTALTHGPKEDNEVEDEVKQVIDYKRGIDVKAHPEEVGLTRQQVDTIAERALDAQEKVLHGYGFRPSTKSKAAVELDMAYCAIKTPEGLGRAQQAREMHLSTNWQQMKRNPAILERITNGGSIFFPSCDI